MKYGPWRTATGTSVKQQAPSLTGGKLQAASIKPQAASIKCKAFL